MTSTGKDCNNNSDCPSNVCIMTYLNGEPAGRKCMTGASGRYTKNCQFPRDCNSGVCEKIYDSNGKYVAKRCVKAPNVDTDTAYNSLFGSERSNRYGVLNDNATQSDLSLGGSEGPISEAIIKLISVIGDLFSVIIYNFRTESYDYDNQGIMYSIFMRMALSVFYAITGAIGGGTGNQGGLIFGIMRSIHHNDETNKCDTKSQPFDLYYLRLFLTILFPPLGVLMAKGFTGMKYIIISCILTTLFYSPGLIYSLAVISSSKHAIKEQSQKKYLIEKEKEKEKLAKK